MNYTEFAILLASAPAKYAFALVVSITAYFLIVRKRILSVFDPLLFNLIFASFGAAVVLFLFLTGEIQRYFFLQFCATEFLYLICLVAIPRSHKDKKLEDRLLTTPHSRRFLQGLYLSSAAIFSVSQISAYAVGGIPLFSDNSRLQYYTGGSGFGLLYRVISVSSFFCWYLLIYRFVYRWKIRYWPVIGDFFVLFLLVAGAILSGSKSTFITVAFLIFYFRLIHRRTPQYPPTRDRWLSSLQRTVLLTTSLGALLVLVISGQADGLATAAGAFAYRLAVSGDTYFMAYPHNTLSALNPGNPIFAFFSGPLETFRLVAPGSLPEPIGFQLFRAATGMPGLFGPNPRHNVFGLVYFGLWGSMIYSAVLGLSVGLVRNVGLRFIKIGGFSELVFVLCAISVVSVNTDVNAFIGPVTDLLLMSPVLLGLAFGLSYAGAHNSVRSRVFTMTPK